MSSNFFDVPPHDDEEPPPSVIPLRRKNGHDPAPTEYAAIPFSAASLGALEPYDFVYRHWMVSGYFTALGAPTATGKSALITALAVSIAIGRDLLSGKPLERRPVWIINTEDRRDDLLKLVWACCQNYRIEPVELEGWLFLDSGREKQLLVAKAAEDGSVLVLPVVEALQATCAQWKIGALFIDPIMGTHALPENDNVSMDEYCAIWNRLAESLKIAIVLAMHFRKGGIGGEIDSFRGASAIISKSRVGITLSVMTKEEAEKLGVSEERRRLHLRLDSAKQNLSPPPDRAEWLFLQSALLSIGDSMRVVESWSPPSPWEGLSMASAVRCLELIDAGPGSGEYYTASARGRSNDRWAGSVLVNAGRDEAQATQILNQWLKSNALLTGEYHSPKTRKLIACVRVDPAKLAEMRAAARTTENEGLDC